MRWRRLLCVLALLAPARSLVASPPPAEAAPVQALLVGDSVMNGMAQGYGATARAHLAARHSFILDTAGCRRLIAASCSIGSGPRPTNAITVVRDRAGQYDGSLVMAVGYNDPSSGVAGIGAAVDATIAETRRTGISDVVWLTYREAGSASNVARFRANNAILRAKTAEYPELRLADWSARSAGLPASWFSDDGIHLGASAATAMADLIGEALDAAPPSTSLPPQRCSPDLWVGAVPNSALPAAPIAHVGGVHLIESPVRLLDTRDQAGKVGAGRFVTVPVTGTIGVDADATAAIVTVVSVQPCADGFVTLFPCGTSPPLASMLNARAGEIVANSALVALGDGAICIFTSQPTDVVVDLTGFVAAGGAATATADPRRLVDTRQGEAQLLNVAQRRLAPRQGLTIDLTPALAAGADIAALTLNITAAQPAADGFISLLPGACSAAAPTTSSLNVSAGHDAAAAATVLVVAGRACVYSSVATDLVVDLQATHGPVGRAIQPVEPVRVFDSRASQRVPAGAETRLPGILPPPATDAIVNVTAVNPAGNGFISVYPCSAQRPVVSNLNFTAGAIVANRALVAGDATGDVCLFASVATDVVIDVEAWLGP